MGACWILPFAYKTLRPFRAANDWFTFYHPHQTSDTGLCDGSETARTTPVTPVTTARDRPMDAKAAWNLAFDALKTLLQERPRGFTGFATMTTLRDSQIGLPKGFRECEEGDD